MAHAGTHHAALEAPVLSVLEHERSMALSKREWKFRIAGYGYGIREIGGRQVLTSLARGTALGFVPAGLA